MTVAEAAAVQFARAGGAPKPLEVPEAVLPLACAAEFDTVYVGVIGFTYIYKAVAHAVRGGFDSNGLPAAEGPATPDRMSADQLVAARHTVLGML